MIAYPKSTCSATYVVGSRTTTELLAVGVPGIGVRVGIDALCRPDDDLARLGFKGTLSFCLPSGSALSAGFVTLGPQALHLDLSL
ncbi:hypothetical protein ACO229_14130 [Promicromonospora sp. MS192]|uniref:hypothetical protein n=1 Tax=Promicromonospora sp. MS192 TaxID=3412684 RepID=UPI003C2B99EE